MVTARVLSSRLLRDLRRPPGYVDQTKWLFGGGALLSLLLLTPEALVNVSDSSRILGLALSVITLVLCLRHVYLRGQSSLVIDVLTAASIFGFSMECASPEVAFSFAFPYMWFRAMYGTISRLVLDSLMIASVFVLATTQWTAFPGHPTATPFIPMVSTLPVLFLSVAFFRHLTVRLTAHDQARHRDAALAELGAKLLGAQTVTDIRACGQQAAAAICYATPGLGLVVVRDAGDALLIGNQAGEVGALPKTLPKSVLPQDAPSDRLVPAGAGTDGLEPPRSGGQWMCLALLDPADSWVLLRCPRDAGGDIVTAVMSAANQIALATRNHDAHQELDTRAYTDALTGLANRSAFTRALDETYAEPGSVVLFLDLDDFKHVNDGFGHASGDELLCTIADRLASTVRSGDICARLGGDEFAIILRGVTTVETATVIAQRLVDLVAKPVTLDAACAQVGASIGLAFGSDILTAERLLQHADTAMYAAKSSGKNRYFVYDESMGGGGVAERIDVLV